MRCPWTDAQVLVASILKKDDLQEKGSGWAGALLTQQALEDLKTKMNNGRLRARPEFKSQPSVYLP